MAILVFSPNGTYVAKPTLEAARTSADCIGKTVVVTSALTAAQSDITAAWPTDRALEVKKGGSIANTLAFTINSSFSAGLYQVFTGAGAVTGLKESMPEWFGNDSAAIVKAINSAPRIKFTKGITYVTASFGFAGVSNKYLYGGGTLQAAASGTALISISLGAYNITIDGLELIGYGSGLIDRGINIDASYDIHIIHCKIHGFNEVGIMYGNPTWLVSEYPIEIFDNDIYYNGTGIHIPTGEYATISHNRITLNGTRWSNNSTTIDNAGANAAALGGYSGWGAYGAFGNCRVENNIINQNFYGLALIGNLGTNPDHSSISGNVINHNQAYGLHIAALGNTEQVVNNEILSTVGPGVWPPSGTSISLIIYNVHNLGFSLNTVDGGAAATTRLDNVVRSRFIGNTFYSNANVTEATQCDDNIWLGNDFMGAAVGVTHNVNTSRYTELAQLVNNVATAITQRVPTLLLSWVNYDAAYKPITYWQGLDGSINIQGVIKVVAPADAQSVFMNLPLGFRPSLILDIPCLGASGTVAGIRIYSNGDVQQLSAGVTSLAINASFRP